MVPRLRRRAVIRLPVLAAAGALAAPARARAGNPGRIVVELYTSQGCSSCPLADQFLRELARRDDVVALAFHVDYWDHLGWKDPHARPENAKRQRAYVAALGARYVFTPQMVVDGRFQDVGSNRQRIEDLIARAREARGDAPGISFAPAGGGGSAEIGVAAGAAPPSETWVWAIYCASTRANDVPSGENKGRHLATTNVVCGVVRLGRYDGSAFAARLDPATRPPDCDGVAILVQGAGYGPIRAARGFALG